MKKKRELSIGLALFGFFAPLVVLLALIFSGVSIMLGLTAAICVEGLFGVWLGHSWEELEESAMKGIGRVNQTVIVMILIGMLIGVWISAGSVQTMLYYGINLITPKLFLPVAFIICVITSLVTGTSWGTAGTMGIALIGVAQGLEIPVEMAAGAIISGALVGDKLSPLSDTTLLASATSGVKLFDHIMSLMYVTVPASIIALITYTLLGMHHGSAEADLSAIQVLSDTLQNSCNLNVFMLIPLLFVLVLSAMRKPTIPVFAGGLVLGCVWAMVFQGATLTEVVTAAISGFVSTTGNADVDSGDRDFYRQRLSLSESGWEAFIQGIDQYQIHELEFSLYNDSDEPIRDIWLYSDRPEVVVQYDILYFKPVYVAPHAEFTARFHVYIRVDGEIEESAGVSKETRTVVLNAHVDGIRLEAVFSGYRYMDLKVLSEENN